MMNQRILIRTLCCFFGIVSSASAAIEERDWLASGDGLLTYDDVNNREWLDLTETLNWALESVLNQTGAGGLFEGFTIAVFEDVRSLSESAGIDTTTNDYGQNHVAASSLINLVGDTGQAGVNPQGIGYSAGFVYELSHHPFDNSILARYYEIVADDGLHPFGASSPISGLVARSPVSWTGAGDAPATWLYRPAQAGIPEPASMVVWLVIGASVAVVRYGRRRYAAR